MTRPTAKALTFASVAVGWLTSGYLFYRLLRLGAGAGGDDLCSAVFGRGCDETLVSPSSYQFGFPLAGWGLVYFAVVGLLLAIGVRRTEQAARLLTAAGAGASLVMTWWLFSGRVPLCPLCLLVHAANFALAASLWRTGLDGEPGRRRQAWAGAAFAALLAGIVFQALTALPGRHGSGMLDRAELLAAFEAAEPVEIPVTGDGKILGPPDAPVRLVVFSSFQCPGCAGFAADARHLAEHFGDNVAVVFKHFPLESECNPALSSELQPRSCEAAEAAEAAGLQGAFWWYHDGLFDSDLSASEDALAALAIGAGLDLDRWQADRASFAVRAAVQLDAELGLRLEVDQTPTVYVNGRRAPSPSLPALEILIEELLAG